MELLTDIAQLASTLGLGAFLGILIKHFLDKSRNSQVMLFEARRRAYKDVIGRINNFFSEDDMRGLGRLERRMRMNSFFSESLLLGGRQLQEAIHAYMDEVDEVEERMNKDETSEEEAAQLDEQLSQTISKIEALMRKELGVR
ncbi:MAG: hypothetical protein H6760_05235 [Candidatus Nomurabacteria bacterium]|nr:MAG: hypothetical protein H6760_05235 [Candidatus Nomurabacteria bacterium]